MSDRLDQPDPPIAILLLGLTYLAIYLGLAWLYSQTFHSLNGVAFDWNSQESQQLARGVEYMTALYWGFGAFCLAFWRVILRHPFYQRGSLQWLRSTPWRRGMPLPLGSPMPGLVEILLIALAVGCLVWVLPPLTLVWLVSGYALVFTLFVALPYLFHSNEKEGYELFGVLLLAGLLVLFYESPWLVGLTSAAVYAVACYGLYESLEGMSKYPKKTDSDGDAVFGGVGLSGVEPAAISTPTTWGQATMISLLIGFWAGILHETNDATAEALLLTSAAVIVLPFIRLMCYTAGYASPISLMQRLRTRRYFTAAYDTVYLSPALALLGGGLLLLGGYIIGLHEPVVTGISIFCCLFILLGVGPARQRWQLTAGHRVVQASNRVAVSS